MTTVGQDLNRLLPGLVAQLRARQSPHEEGVLSASRSGMEQTPRPVDPSREQAAKNAPPSRLSTTGPLILALALGSLTGIGGYTFRYAEGFSYFKTDPKACVNCHIMQRQYNDWSRSSHHAAAVCVDCHLPQAFIPKYLAKAENGWRHGKLFTTQTFKEPIEVKPAGRAILQDNCVRCHQTLVDSMVAHRPPASSGPSEGKPECLHCHWTVGHGERAALGGSLRTAEVPSSDRGDPIDTQPARLSP